MTRDDEIRRQQALKQLQAAIADVAPYFANISDDAADDHELLEAATRLVDLVHARRDGYPPEALEQLRDLKPLRRRGEHFVPDESEERVFQHEDAPGTRIEYELRRDPGESKEDFAARRTLFENGGRLVFDVAPMPIEDVHEMVIAMGLDGDSIRRKNALFRSIIFALEAGGITGHEQPDFAIEHGLRPDFFPHAAESKFSGISLDRLATLYDAAAGKVGWLTFNGIVDEHLGQARAGRYIPAWEPGSVTTNRPAGLHDSQQAVGKYYSISFPLIPGDETLRPRDIRFKYALLEALARLRSMTVTEVSQVMGDSVWWTDLNAWVDQQWGR